MKSSGSDIRILIGQGGMASKTPVVETFSSEWFDAGLQLLQKKAPLKILS